MPPARALAFGLALVMPASMAQATPGFHVIERIAGPDGGWDFVRVDTANNRVLVVRTTSVMAIDLATKAVTTGLAPGALLHDALPLNDEHEILVTHGGEAIAVFADAKTGDALATVKTGVGPDAAVFDASSGLLLVMDHVGGDVVLINAKTHAEAGRIVVGGELELAAVDGRGRAYVNIEDQNAIAVLDLKARKVVARYPLPGCDGPTGLAYDAAEHQLLAACDGASVLVSARSGKVLATLKTGPGADGAAFDPVARLAFVPSGGAGTLSVIAIGKGSATLVETVPTQTGARTLALDPRSGRIYLPTARYGPAPAAGKRRPMLPGTFEVLVVGR